MGVMWGLAFMVEVQAFWVPKTIRALFHGFGAREFEVCATA